MGFVGEAINVVRETVANDGRGERLPRQALFAEYVGQLPIAGPMPTKLFYGITIGTDCRSCGLCARICTNKAISVQDHGDVLEFYHSPQSCTGCSVCVGLCPQQALSLTTAPC